MRLIDIKDEAPIQKVTEKGILLETGEEIELDTIIYATGFDAGMGPILAVDFQGVNGLKPKDVWKNGPQTFLGFLVKGFPNMTMVRNRCEYDAFRRGQCRCSSSLLSTQTCANISQLSLGYGTSPGIWKHSGLY